MTTADFVSFGPDIYQIRNAVKGNYKIKFINYGKYRWDIYGPFVVKASIYTNYGRPNEELKEVIVRVTREKQIVDIAEISWE